MLGRERERERELMRKKELENLWKKKRNTN
jgi:hypothetical protein